MCRPVSQDALGAPNDPPAAPEVDQDGWDGGSEEDYDSGRENEDDPMSLSRARRKLTSAITDAGLDVATEENFDKPWDENFNHDDSRPTLSGCKSFVVEVSEGLNWYAQALQNHGVPEGLTRYQTLIEIYRGMQKQGRDIGPRCVMSLSLLVGQYLLSFRMLHLAHDESDEERPDEDAAPPPVTWESVFEMRHVRASPDEDPTRRYSTTGHHLLLKLLDLQNDVNGALMHVGVQTPVTFRVLAPHIVYLQQGDADMQD